MSGHCDDARIQALLADGASAFLRKPVTIDTLLLEIDQALNDNIVVTGDETTARYKREMFHKGPKRGR